MKPILYWLRNDLRIHDNACLHRVSQHPGPLLMVYCFDPRNYRDLAVGFAKTGRLRHEFLCQTLENLGDKVRRLGNQLLILRGEPERVLPTLVDEHGVGELIYQKEIASEELTVEKALENALQDRPCVVNPIWGKTLYHPDDAPFAPEATPLTSKTFRIKLSKESSVRELHPTPQSLPSPPLVGDWGRIPIFTELSSYEKDIKEVPVPDFFGGETPALARLQHYTFDSELLTNYRWTRNRSLGLDYSSKLSPWLAVGALSPRMVYWEVKRYEREVKKNISTWWLIFELVWRDYFKYLAMRFGKQIFAAGGIKSRDTGFRDNHELFERWRTGSTGVPFVDAHMRQLNLTGFMSNRGRVNCASFLTRDYHVDWRWGAAWFEHKLLDYDVCSNWLNWSNQALEAYYTNPVHQGWKYDRKGEYVRTWLPALAGVPGPIIQAPWLLSAQERENYGVRGYPQPESIYSKWTRSINRIQNTHAELMAKSMKDERL